MFSIITTNTKFKLSLWTWGMAASSNSTSFPKTMGSLDLKKKSVLIYLNDLKKLTLIFQSKRKSFVFL